MKKILAVILCLLMVFAMAACGGTNDDVRGEVNAGASKVESEEKEENFSFGTTGGSTYKNDFLGLGCNLGEGWSFYTDEQIAELNNMALDYTDDEFASAIENATIIYDMFANNATTFANMNVNLEKRSLFENGSKDNIKNLLKNTVPTLEETYINMGYTNPVFEVEDIEVDGETFAGIKGTAEIQSLKINIVLFSFKKGQYLASVTIASFDEAEAQSLLDNFYLYD